MSLQRPEAINYVYRFNFPSGENKEFKVVLDGETLNLIPSYRESYPAWVNLQCCQCPVCPLSLQEHAYCPIAVNIVELVESFANALSHDKVDLEVTTDNRVYSIKALDLQRAIGSLLGIYMATSGCPVLDKLKPMAYFHLPFATRVETTYRVLSTYLLAQYFLAQEGGVPDWELKDLVATYQDIRLVNESFANRLRTINIEDANLNAVVILNVFADTVVFSVSERFLKEIRKLFSAYFRR